MNLTIRSARTGDADVICEFNRLMALETENKALNLAVLKPGVVAMLSDVTKGRYFVATVLSSPPGRAAGAEGDEVVGQLGITLEWSDWRNGNWWWIQSVYVRKDARRFGVFRKLYEHVREQARQTPDVIGLRLYVEHENQIAQETYRKMGMAMTGYHVMEEQFPV